MIMSQERAFLKSQQQLQALEGFVEQAARDEWRIDQVERELFSRLLALGHTLLSAFVAAQGDGDLGAKIATGDGRTVRRLKGKHARRYLSIFGELLLYRRVYAEREKQQIERAPLDERLGLPEGEFSYVLQDWLGRLCLKESFHEAVTDLREWLGVAPSERATEQMNQRMAGRAEAFGVQHSAPPPDEEAEILVATADGKGVPMRRPLEERVRRGPRRVKGEKANKKQMAYVGAVYTIDRFRRTADEVLDEVARRERAAHRPAPQHKQVWAEMTRVAEGESCTGRERLFIEMAIAAHERDPTRQKTLVCLMDGEAALWDVQDEWLPRAVGILDLFHVLERLWGVAHVFYREGSPEAEQFVAHHLRLLLEGKVGYVIGRFKRLRGEQALRGSQRRTVTAAIGYYENNRRHMRYDEYLAAGYPIGSGVAEGACRHVVKDRLEQTGMRWTVAGAQAMLHLRAIYLNG
ncbi:MAG TPA: ISKra4 family transposase, partial [Pirellulales bacterium]|nr:ISKra4 family transposase [Pirellulales bacterium]